MQIHEIKRNTKLQTKKRVGRGGKRGKTSGRGMKGQKSRAGNSMRPEMRDIIKKLPKKRGYRFASIQTKPNVVNTKTLNENFKDGEIVSPETLVEKKVIRKKSGNFPQVKILADGKIAIKIKVTGCYVSVSAKNKIEKAGGSIE